ncbi:MAG: hypothetical protein IKH69_01145 [Bacteroidaceae bacterium]|nr:hypothetical protein [Bacteroidaceae bacterium]MBR3013616.1 hypothetical protein [Bacteroidaceae bacterium]
MKTWTRPKIKVQKFVPNFCDTACYSDFFEGKAWVDDSFHVGNKTEIFDKWDIYNENWLGTDPATGKKYIKVDEGDVITSWDAYMPIGSYLPTSGDYNWEYDKFDLKEIEKGAHNTDRVYYVITTNNPQILARSKNAS